MSALIDRLEEMGRLYRGYDLQLQEWLDGAETTGPRGAADAASVPVDDPGIHDAWLARLSKLEEAFIARARVLGAAADAERAALSRQAGRELTIREAAARAGGAKEAERVCTEAMAAVAAVARRRVEALKRLEAFREGAQTDRGRLAVVRRLGKMYSRRREQGKRVDGRV